MKSTISLCDCKSSQINGIGFDAATNTMAVQFKNKAGPGNIYHYANVTQELHDEFMKAESKGRFFGGRIKDAKDPDTGGQLYPATKMVDEETKA